MLIAGVLSMCAAAATAWLGLRTLAQSHRGDPARLLLRAMAPMQLAAAVMLAAGGAVMLAAPTQAGVAVLIVSVVGAVSTVAAGSWQTARSAVQRQPASGCRGSCAACTLPCR
ncbi:MAG: hypothetical protein ACRDZY_06845 [Acidimicrobiales bacterium]